MARFDDGVFPGFHKTCPRCGRTGVSANMINCGYCDAKIRELREKATDKYCHLITDLFNAISEHSCGCFYGTKFEEVKKYPDNYEFITDVLYHHGIKP